MESPQCRRLLVLLAALVFALWPAPPAHPLSPPLPAEVGRKVVVIVANRLLLSDLQSQSLPTIRKMLDQGAAALVSPNCLGAKSEHGVLLTASAGTGCKGATGVRDVYDADEALPSNVPAGLAHTLNTGYKAPRDSAVFLGLAKANRANEELSSVAYIGALGDALRSAGLTTAAVGNADMPPEVIDRSAAVLAADSRGIIDIGWLNVAPHSSAHAGPGHSEQVTSTFSDVGRMQEMVRECMSRADFVVVNYGDTTRLDEQMLSISDSAFEHHKARILRGLDEMLDYLMRSPEASRAVFVLVSFSPPADGPWMNLTPMVVYPWQEPALLVSSSTRTPGLIAASDFAPTVLGLFGLPPTTHMTGRPAYGVRAELRLEALAEMDTRTFAGEVLIRPVCWFFAGLGAFSLTAAAVLVAFGLRASRRVQKAVRLGMLASASSPLAMLLAVLAPAGVLGYSVGTLVALALVVVAGLALAPVMSRGRDLRAMPVVVVFALTSIAIAVDALAGGVMGKFAVPSSFLLNGFRYYGIGNEYGGALVCMSAGAVLPFLNRRWLVLGVGIAVVGVLGIGSIGANYGGAMAATVTFGLLAMVAWRGGFGGRHVALASLLGVVLALGFALSDAWLSGPDGTHAGRATATADRLGGGYLVAIALRKVLMNLRLITSKTATNAYLVFIPCVLLWFYGVQGKLKRVLDARAFAGVKALLIGAAVGFLVNDSGVVMAGLMVGMTVLLLLYSIVEVPTVWRTEQKHREEAAACQGS